jgi:Mat/Ecp fimbriae major subunit
MAIHFSIRLSLLSLATFASLVAVDVAQAATAPTTSRARVNRPITLTNSRDLNFGTVIRGATAGTVTLNARTGARTSTGGVVLAGTGFTTAAFAGSGTKARIVTVSLGATSITLTNGSGPGTMTVNTFRVSANGAAVQTLPRNHTIPASGAMTYAIGGRLNVAANQADGDYTGTIALTMNYQ